MSEPMKEGNLPAVVPPGDAIPASFELPWSERQASQLQTAAEQTKKGSRCRPDTP